MTSVDMLYAKIVQQIENYITEDNLRNDYTLTNHVLKSDGWIRLELLSRCNQLSNYTYDTILQALQRCQSTRIELSSFDPRCVRRRCQPSTGNSIHRCRTVIVRGLPYDIRYEELREFFNRFYPVSEVRLFSLSDRHEKDIHVIFDQPHDALRFAQQSKLEPIIYVKEAFDSVYQHNYTLRCQMLDDDYVKETNQLNDQPNLIKGRSFSTRLNNHPSRPALEMNSSGGNSKPGPSPPLSVPSASKSHLKSSRCATEQILFCQNMTHNKSPKPSETVQEGQILKDQFRYEFYTPTHLLKQTGQCVIISALNPHCFTIQFTQDALEFDKFQREINTFYNTIDEQKYRLTAEQIRLNLCVICLDSNSSNNESVWNRTQILDFDPSDNTVNVFHVDLGTWEEYVPLHRLRRLTESFHQHLVFSVTCRLADIRPLNNENDQWTWSEEAISQFLAVLNQATTEIELLSFTSNGCCQVNLFAVSSGEYIHVNDYLVHIKKAKLLSNATNIDNQGQTNTQVDEQDINGNEASVHPVIALYNRLGEVFQQSLAESRTTSISSSSLSSPSTLPQSYVKLIHINPESSPTNTPEDSLSLIFVRDQRTIFVPDFNICALLQRFDSNIDLHTIENYAFAIRYNFVQITREINFDIFTQLSSVVDLRYTNSIALYPLDFVIYILQNYHFPAVNVFVALESAKRMQQNAADLALWFAADNELNNSFTPVSSDSLKSVQSNDQRPPIRLPFSNRLVNPM